MGYRGENNTAHHLDHWNLLLSGCSRGEDTKVKQGSSNGRGFLCGNNFFVLKARLLHVTIFWNCIAFKLKVYICNGSSVVTVAIMGCKLW